MNDDDDEMDFAPGEGQPLDDPCSGLVQRQ